MKTRGNMSRFEGVFEIGLVVALAVLAVTVEGATATWTGGSNGMWSNAGNWSVSAPVAGDTVLWGAGSTANKVSTNDFVGLSLAAISYAAAPDGIVLNGNDLTLTSATGVFAPPTVATLNGMTINMNLALPAAAILPNNAGYTVLNGVLSGAGTSMTIRQTVAGAGFYTLYGANTFSGNVTLGANNGAGNCIVNTLKNTGIAQSLGTGSMVYFGDSGNGDRAWLYYTGGASSTDKGFKIGGDATANATGGIFANGSGALTWTGNQTLATTTSARTFTLGGFNTDANTVTSSIGNNNSGPMALTKAGRGTWVLKGANTFTNGLTINAGTLTLDYANNPTVVNSTNTPTLGGGTLEFKANSSGSTQTLGNVTASTDTGLSTVRVNQNGGAGMAVTLGTVATSAGRSALLFDLNGSGASSVTIGTAITPDSGTQGRVIIRTASGSYDFAHNSGSASNPLTNRAATATFGAANGSTADYLFTNTASIGDGASNTTISCRSLRIAPTLNNQTMTISNVGAYAGGGAAGMSVGNTALAGGVLYDGGTNDFTIAAAAPAYGTNGVSIRNGAALGFVLHHMGTGKLTIGNRVYLAYAGSSPGTGTATPLGLFGTGLIDWQGSVNSINGGALAIHGTTVRISGTNDAVKLDTTATGKGSMNIAFNAGGVLEAVNSDITRNIGTGDGAIQWKGDGGFSAYGGNRAVNLQGGAALYWTNTSFVVGDSALVLSSAYSDSTIDFQNAIDFGGLQRVVRVANGSAAVDARLSGVLSAGLTGGLVKEGDGTLELTAANTYAGETWVNAGTLRLGNGGTAGALSPSSAIRVAAGATFAVNRSDTVTQGTDFSTAAITGAGGFTQAGSGKTILNTTNTYTGPTTVSAGMLRINGNQSGATGAVSVASGATLGGFGTIGGPVTIANSATALLYPSNNFAGGTLTCVTNVTFAGSSAVAKFDLSANAGSGNDKVVLTNGATLTCGGATVTINATGTLAMASYTLFDVGASGTISGSFAATPTWTGTAPANSNSYSIALDGTGKQVLLKYASGTVPVVGADAASTLVSTPVTINVTTNDSDFIPPIYQVLSNQLWAGSTVSISAGTNLIYTPAAGSNGVDQFQYVLTNAVGSSTGTVTVTVAVPPPTAGNDTAITWTNTPVTISATTNDTNFLPPISSVLSNQLWAGSTVSISSDTNLLYTPATGSNGVDQFQYVITNAGGSVTGTVAVTVILPLTANSDTASTTVSTPVTVSVTTNDANFLPPIASVLSNLLWTGSSVSIQNGTNLFYTPASGSNGVDQFQYVITNAYGHSATGLVSVTVTVPPPTAGNDTAITWTNTPVTVNVTTNDANFLPPISSVLSNQLWAGSTVSISSGTNLLYTPAAGSNGTDQFQYVITNAVGSATGTVTVTVLTPVSGTYTWSGGGSSANWSIGPNWTNGTAPMAGASHTLQWNSSSTARLTSTNDISGLIATLTFNATPSGPVAIGGTALTLGGNISGTYAGTVTVNMDLTMSGNRIFNLTGVGSQLNVNGVINESGGARSLTCQGVATYLNNTNAFSGSFTMSLTSTTYINTLGNSGTPQSTGTGGTIVFAGVGDTVKTLIYTGGTASTAKSITLGPSDASQTTGMSGVFLNNGTGPVTWSANVGSTGGTIQNASTVRNFTLGGSNTDNNEWTGIIRNNNAAGDGTVSFTKTGTGKWILSGTNTYTGPTTVSAGTLIINGNQSGATGAVSVASGATLGGSGTVGGPVTIADSATALLYPNHAFAGGTLTCARDVTFAGSSAVAKFDLSANAGSGNDKVVLTNSATLTCGGATVTINSTGTLALADYTLFDVGASGTISGSFAATPVWIGTAPANSNNYSIAVAGTKVLLDYVSGAAPVAGADAAATLVGTPVTVNVTTNDSDFSPPISQVLSNQLWAGSTVAISGGTNLLYTPAADSNGVDQFQYVITNATGSATGTVTVTVAIPPLTAGNDAAATTVGNAVTIHVTTNDANFVPPIGSVVSNLLWAGSTVDISGTNLLYTPATGSNGVDQFQYVITNAYGDAATGLVSVTVAAPPPTASNDTAITRTNTPVTINVTANDSNFTPPISLVLSNLLWAGSTVSISGSTNLLYTPAAGSNGTDQFQYVLTNAYGSATGTVTVTVAAAGTAYWHAQGTTAYWSDSGNWDDDNTKDADTYTPLNGDSLAWNANSSSNKVSTNDLIGLSVLDMTFTGSTGIRLTGNAITMQDTAGNNVLLAAGSTIDLDLVVEDSSFSINGFGTINGDISESGGARSVSIGSGTSVTLNGSNSFSGSLTISVNNTAVINTLANSDTPQSLGQGSVQYGNTSSDGTVIYTGGAATTDKPFQIGRNHATSSNLGGGSFIHNGTGAVTWNGPQVLAASVNSPRTFTLGGTNTNDNNWHSNIANNDPDCPISITKTNAGKWILSGTNTYSGPTTVSEGTLVINGNQSGATGAVTVVSGATLGGTGTVGGAVSVSAGAALAPGHGGIGTLTVTGAVTLAEGAVYQWECQSGLGDRVALKGPGGTLTLPSVATVQVSQVSGTFQSPATLFTATALAGATDLSGWTITGLADSYARIEGNTVLLKTISGTVFRFR